MIDNFFYNIITYLRQFPAELSSILLLFVCSIIIYFLWKHYSSAGLIMYTSVATITANIQVLQFSDFLLYKEPMALGNVMFATIFLALGIITEKKGETEAKRCVQISFLAQIITAIVMIISLGHSPELSSTDKDLKLLSSQNYNSIYNIFTPSPRILAASLLSYLLTQYFVIYMVSKFLDRKYISSWIRQNLAISFAAVTDTIIFSFLAWQIFSSHPMGFKVIWFSYIIPSLVFRLIINVFFIPVIYKIFKNRNEL